jgi:hypothetical protein
VLKQRGQAGCSQRHSQDDAIITAEEDIRDLRRRASDAFHREAFPKQRLGPIGHLGPLNASVIRVVEVGFKKWCRSTVFTINDCLAAWLNISAMVAY